jgi:hypothetical protein
MPCLIAGDTPATPAGRRFREALDRSSARSVAADRDKASR